MAFLKMKLLVGMFGQTESGFFSFQAHQLTSAAQEKSDYQSILEIHSKAG